VLPAGFQAEMVALQAARRARARVLPAQARVQALAAQPGRLPLQVREQLAPVWQAPVSALVWVRVPRHRARVWPAQEQASAGQMR
jgi:hypothetical protein